MSHAPRTADRTTRATRSPLAGWMTSTAVFAAAAALLTACSDVTAPAAAGSALAPSAAPQQAVWSAGDTTYTTFTVQPGSAFEQTFAGVHKLSMPAGAVCDPQTAGYGAGTWDAACTPAASAITFTSRAWRDAAGRPQITFSPDVRFVPGKVVTLRLKDAQASVTAGSAILWCPTGATTCVNESATDASLASHLDGNGQFVFRRLKHFSGYQIILGRESETAEEGAY